MKHAVVGPQGTINRISDTEPQFVGEQATVVQITDEQAATVQAGREATPRVFYFLVDGALKTGAEKQAITRAAREAERIASLPPEVQAAMQLKAGLLAVWDTTFTVGEKAFLKPIYDAAIAKMDAGDIEGVKELILTAPSISESLDAKRATIAALLPTFP